MQTLIYGVLLALTVGVGNPNIEQNAVIAAKDNDRLEKHLQDLSAQFLERKRLTELQRKNFKSIPDTSAYYKEMRPDFVSTYNTIQSRHNAYIDQVRKAILIGSRDEIKEQRDTLDLNKELNLLKRIVDNAPSNVRTPLSKWDKYALPDPKEEDSIIPLIIPVIIDGIFSVIEHLREEKQERRAYLAKIFEDPKLYIQDFDEVSKPIDLKE
ncbi:MAG: hypothetical protein SFV55_29215 [Haliscomenobacter sp.]|uniref:hypothetical protein n=1 Tax=Haliscomenobacter sp. TaxID=2717303 RepID=UPI0029AEAF19|nr:hypothetical protein [Haliscomenobacter sp.]MDX2072550.1 hypothetical protein [Haliscomenobacter sp.]